MCQNYYKRDTFFYVVNFFKILLIIIIIIVSIIIDFIILFFAFYGLPSVKSVYPSLRQITVYLCV